MSTKKEKEIILTRGQLNFDDVYKYILWRLNQSLTQYKKKNKVKNVNNWSAGFTEDEIIDVFIDEDDCRTKPVIYVVTQTYTLDDLNPRETEIVIRWVKRKIALQGLSI